MYSQMEYQDLTKHNAIPFFNGKITYNNIIGLSGTHPKHKEKLELYNQLNLKILISMSIDEAVEKNLIAPYNITVVECELDRYNKNVKAGRADNVFYQTEQATYNYYNRVISQKLSLNQIVPKYLYLNRMRFIYTLKSKNEFAKKLVSKLPGRTLVFTGGIAQAEEMSIYTYHSKTDSAGLYKFKNKEIDTLVMVNSGGVGETFRDVDNLVIVQVNSNQKGDSTQKIARSLVLQEGYTANIYILVVKDTVDEEWKTKVLEGFNVEKIKHVSYKDYE